MQPRVVFINGISCSRMKQEPGRLLGRCHRGPTTSDTSTGTHWVQDVWGKTAPNGSSDH